jgi:hypothetical protein
MQDLVYVGQSKIINESSKLEIGQGIFAKQDIQKGEFICYYSGILVDECDGKQDYIFANYFC